MDTCYLIAFIDKKDEIRRYNRDISRAIRNPRERYRISVPAIGEAFLKINEKRDLQRKREAFKTLEELLDTKVLETIGLGYGSDAFSYAKALMDKCTGKYGRDQLTPTDALIISDALIDNECTTVYTKDTKFLWDVELTDEVNDIRRNINISYPELRFSEFKY